MKANQPYDFIFDYLPRDIIVRKLFGMYYIYWNKKHLLILRKLSKNENLNGIWIATVKAHHEGLKKEVPGLRQFLLDNGKTHDSDWQLLQEQDDKFETDAITICGFICHGDPRIGKLTEKSILL
jgi:hypothetical protein